MFSPVSKHLQPRGESVEQALQDLDIGSQRHAIPVLPSLLTKTKQGAKRCSTHESMTREITSWNPNAHTHRHRNAVEDILRPVHAGNLRRFRHSGLNFRPLWPFSRRCWFSDQPTPCRSRSGPQYQVKAGRLRRSSRTGWLVAVHVDWRSVSLNPAVISPAEGPVSS